MKKIQKIFKSLTTWKIITAITILIALSNTVIITPSGVQVYVTFFGKFIFGYFLQF